MARSSKVPTKEEHARLWAQMDFKQRRQVLRAVNRGERMDGRKDARVAVGVARQQQRYWRWAWLFGPAMGFIQVPNWSAVVITAAFGGLLMGGLSWWRLRRAVTSEQANLERIGAA